MPPPPCPTGVPEITNSVDQLLKLLNELTPSAYDRTLVFPLFLCGGQYTDSDCYALKLQSSRPKLWYSE